MKHIIIHGDCIAMMRNIEPESIDCIISDIPYGSTKCAWDSVIPLLPMWREIERIVKPNSPIVLFGGQPFTSRLIMSKIYWYRNIWVWDKVRATGFQIAKYRPLRQHEDIVVFSKERCNYYPIMEKRDKPERGKMYGFSESSPLSYTDDKVRTYTHRFPVSIVRHSNAVQTHKQHPTQKPVTLMEYLVQTYSLEGDTVLDFTCGSGTTGVACKHLNRNFIGIDSDAEYCSIAEQRMQTE